MKELKKQWKEHQFHKCYLFYGTETYLMKNYEEALVQALLPPGTESMNSDILEGKKATAATIMDAAETLPFLNDKRLVLIRNSEFFHRNGRKEEGERLVEFLKDSPESTCILFVEEKAEKTWQEHHAGREILLSVCQILRRLWAKACAEAPHSLREGKQADIRGAGIDRLPV